MISDEATREFLVESHEGLDQLDRDFVALEANPQEKERIAAIFRTIHTIKGTSGFLGFGNLEKLAHAGESLLSLLRDGTLSLQPAMTSALLTLVDRIRASLRCVELEGRESPDVHADLLETLHALRTPDAAAVAAPKAAPKAAAAAAPAAAATPAPAPKAAEPAPAPVAATAPPAPQPLPPPTPAPGPTDAARTAEAGATAITDSNVRVDVGLLDTLMNLVGELVLARNQLLQAGARIEDAAFVRAGQRLNLITAELQEHVMRTRMQPIGNVWGKLPRVVRDLALACGKQVRVEMIGKQTELDRTVLEAIKDPLTHIVRNAVDHGLESPDVRAQRGKGRTGSLILRAYHQGGQVNIEISDDGNGIDIDRVKQKAISRQLVTAERAERMSEYDLTQLVFLPGFSTAETITNVSGRGVGMDVVKTNIERIGGVIDLVSRRGLGTTLKIRIPLTLAIVPALVVTSAEHRFAIPQTNLLELVRLEGEDALLCIENLHGAPVYRLRGQLLPLVYLSRALEIPLPPNDESREPSVNIIVLQADNGQFGLVVDDVHDTEEIVVKPLGKELKGIPLFAGATIMGDGHVALILDVAGLAQASNAVDQVHKEAAKSVAVDAHQGEEKQSLLLFTTDDDTTMALPLSMVARLESFDASQLERSGSRSVVQYRGEILPLIELATHHPGEQAGQERSIPVIVYNEGAHQVGLVVGRILDVVEEYIRVDSRAAATGILGSAIIQGRVTDLMDVHCLIESRAPWLAAEEAA